MATTDWGKLKVVDLKAELKRRGLPQAGRKDELISRLAEADASQGELQQEPVADDAAQLAEATEKVEGEPVPSLQDIPKVPQGQELQEPEASPANASPAKADLPPSIEQQQQQQQQPTDTPIQSPPPRQESPVEPPPEAAAADATQLPAVTPSEAMADAQKRKRRSRSPPPTAHDVQHKRVRIDGEPSAAASPPAEEMPHPNGVMEARRTPEPTPATRDNLYGEQVQVDYGADTPRTSPAVAKIQRMTPEPPSSALKNESPYGHKSEHDDNHGTEPSQPRVDEKKDKKEEELHQQDKSAEPSIHPPTSALYIKNFMRPLRAPMVEEHLIRLATAPGYSPDESLVEDFYLDQIRTHAFVLFRSTAAASRVRAALHNQVWPDESLRKALWVDFVPPDKVRGWIEKEQAGGGRRGSTNRWEVVYETMGDKVETSLQEPGVESKPARPPPPVAPPAPQHMDGPAAPPRQYPGIESAPSGPKGFVHPARMGNIDGLDRTAGAINNPDRRNSGVQDQLPTTRATPRVTYQPVSEDLARRRLDNMRSYLAPDANNRDLGRENNRYTFEAGHQFVDRGREIFEGIRPPHRERERREQERRRAGGGGGPRFGPPPGRYGGGGGGGGRPPRNDYRPPPRSNDFRPDRPPRYNSYGGGRR